MNRRLRLLVAALLLLAWPAAAETDLHPSWLHVAPKLKADRAFEAVSEPPADTDLADSGLGYDELLSSWHLHLREDGKISRKLTMVRRYLTNSGAQQAGNIDIYVDTNREQLELHTAYLRLPSGRRIAVRTEEIQVTDPASPALFSDSKVVVLPIAGIAAGSILYIDFTITRDAASFPLPWGSNFFMQGLVPTARSEIVVQNDRGAGWFQWATNDPDVECVEQGDGLRCVRVEIPAIPLDEHVRSYYDVIPHVAIAERTTWKDLAVTVGELVTRNASASDDMRETLADLAESPPSPSNLASAIHAIATDEIRYLGLSHGDSAVVPAPAAETWERRFGDCKDKTTLFVALAKEAKLPVNAVLTSLSYFDVDTLLLPSSSYFNHMIVCSDALPNDGGCVDPTMSGSPAELPASLQGGIALYLLGEKAGELTKLARRDLLWEVSVAEEYELGCDGRVSLLSSRSLGGPGGNAIRSQLNQVTPAERDQFLRTEWQSLVDSEERAELKYQNLSRSDVPLSTRHKLNDYRRIDSNSQGFFAEADRWLVYYGRRLLSTNQHHDYDLPGLSYESTTYYRLCPASKVQFMGAQLDISSGWGTVRRHYSEVDGAVRVRTHLEIPGRVVSPEEIDDLRRFVLRSLETSVVQFGYH